MKLLNKRDSVSPRHLCQQMKVLVLIMKGLHLAVSVPTPNTCLQRENYFPQWSLNGYIKCSTEQDLCPGVSDQLKRNSIVFLQKFCFIVLSLDSFCLTGPLLVHVDDPSVLVWVLGIFLVFFLIFLFCLSLKQSAKNIVFIGQGGGEDLGKGRKHNR